MPQPNAQRGRQDLQNMSRQLGDAANSLTDDTSFSKVSPIIEQVNNELSTWRSQYGQSGSGSHGSGGGPSGDEARTSNR